MYGLDLFSGCGGLSEALEFYVQPVAYCENNRHAAAVLLSRMEKGEIPTAPIWDDVQTLKASHIKRPIDIVYGGFPCQDISCAGFGAGLGGKRSGLFFEIMRIVSDIRPRFVFMENSPAIRTRGANIVCAELASRGYDCRWLPLSAAEVGANHLRIRWWLLAHATFDRRPEDGTRESIRPSEIPNASSARSIRRVARSSKTSGWWPQSENTGPDWWKFEPNVGRVVHGVPLRIQRIEVLGNAVVPAQAREAFERLMGIKG